MDAGSPFVLAAYSITAHKNSMAYDDSAYWAVWNQLLASAHVYSWSFYLRIRSNAMSTPQLKIHIISSSYGHSYIWVISSYWTKYPVFPQLNDDDVAYYCLFEPSKSITHRSSLFRLCDMLISSSPNQHTASVSSLFAHNQISLLSPSIVLLYGQISIYLDRCQNKCREHEQQQQQQPHNKSSDVCSNWLVR